MTRNLSRRDFLKGSALSAIMLGNLNWMAGLDEAPPTGYTNSPLGSFWQSTTPADLANVDPELVLLSRVTFGPRPGDIAKVKQMGMDAWIEQQLAPNSVPDPQVDSLLSNFPLLSKSAAELAQLYGESQMRKKGPGTLQEAIQGFLGLFEGNANQKTPRFTNPAEFILQLSQATVLRQAFSERQLYETVVDFWTNHFNIYIMKDNDRWLKLVDDREVIRPYALGKFRDLLGASAHSAAMLVYLDNITNTKGVAQENYARELLELHTVGVNGGYTQTDVQELARVLTGWTVTPPRRNAFGVTVNDNTGTFVFNPQTHDTGTKTVLGLKLGNNGVKEGEAVLDMLARHPSTAKFIATKLVRRFVTDNPPASLVERVADTFGKTDGDIKQVLRVLLHSDEFRQSFGFKVKRPAEFVAAATRALNATVTRPNVNVNLRPNNTPPRNPAQVLGDPLILALRTMGQLPFQWPTPDGYPDYADAWVNSNNLLARWNLALAMVANQVPGLKFDLAGQMQDAKIGSAAAAVDFWARRLLNRALPDNDRATLINYMGGDISQIKIRDLVALLLASPHFQYR